MQTQVRNQLRSRNLGVRRDMSDAGYPYTGRLELRVLTASGRHINAGRLIANVKFGANPRIPSSATPFKSQKTLLPSPLGCLNQAQ